MSPDSYRRLILIPVIHTQLELGSMKESVKRIYVKQFGEKRWKEHMEAIEHLWAGIRKGVGRLHLDYDKVRLYQDGLPDCAREEEIVREIASSGSPNHRILVELMGNGATIVGTESPELLLEEYNTTRQVLTLQGSEEDAQLRRRLKKLGSQTLQKRDKHIARRIGETLGAGETGIIFLGMLHSLRRYLPRDIRVSTLRYGRAG